MCAFLKANGPHGPQLLDAFEAQWARLESDEVMDEARVEVVVMAEAPVQEDRGQTQAEEAPFAPPAGPHSGIFQQALPAEEITVEDPPTLNGNTILKEAFLNDVSFLENIDLSFLDD